MRNVRQARSRVMDSPPQGWRHLFAPVGPRSSKVRCLLCGRTGYPGFDGRPNPWQARCLLGHETRCPTCRRPLTNGAALARHLACSLHHACCRDHTTVPAWKNPFHAAALTEPTS